MRILKIIGIGLASIIALILIIALFVRKELEVQREITINRPKAEVFQYVKHLKNQDNFSKWNMTDPNMKKSYKGTDGTVGFVAAWESENSQVGQGEQEIKNIVEGERVDMAIHFIKPFESNAKADFITETANDQSTNLKWAFHGKMQYPFNFMCLFVDVEESLGNDLQTGLNNLKTILEKQ